MTNKPRTIQIFLPHGDPRGIRVAELTTSIVRVIEVPLALLDRFHEMPEAQQVGFYFLVGEDEDDSRPHVYIGQSGALGKRLASHEKHKTFWSRVFVVVSLTNSLTQTHALYLEWKSIQAANEAGRYIVENGNNGSKPHTPAPMEADCLEVFEMASTLLATLGQPVFESHATRKVLENAQTFYAKSPSYDAAGEYTTDGFIVKKGSKFKKQWAPGMLGTMSELHRNKLIESESLVLAGDFYVANHDILFKTPSGAACAVAGASKNGWVTWKDANGKTLDAIKR